MPSKSQMQEIFEFVTMHLATQGKPSFDPADGCRYLDADGCRCAIGSMLTEQECFDFDVGFGGISVEAIIHRGVRHWDSSYTDFLTCLQQAHDYAALEVNAHPQECYLELLDINLRDLAIRFDLRFPEELL